MFQLKNVVCLITTLSVCGLGFAMEMEPRGTKRKEFGEEPPLPPSKKVETAPTVSTQQNVIFLESAEGTTKAISLELFSKYSDVQIAPQQTIKLKQFTSEAIGLLVELMRLVERSEENKEMRQLLGTTVQALSLVQLKPILQLMEVTDLKLNDRFKHGLYFPLMRYAALNNWPGVFRIEANDNQVFAVGRSLIDMSPVLTKQFEFNQASHNEHPNRLKINQPGNVVAPVLQMMAAHLYNQPLDIGLIGDQIKEIVELIQQLQVPIAGKLASEILADIDAESFESLLTYPPETQLFFLAADCSPRNAEQILKIFINVIDHITVELKPDIINKIAECLAWANPLSIHAKEILSFLASRPAIAKEIYAKLQQPEVRPGEIKIQTAYPPLGILATRFIHNNLSVAVITNPVEYVYPTLEIFMINPTGTHKQSVITLQGVLRDRLKYQYDYASWSPDGKYLYFAFELGTVLNVETGERELDREFLAGGAKTWSPNGNILAHAKGLYKIGSHKTEKNITLYDFSAKKRIALRIDVPGIKRWESAEKIGFLNDIQLSVLFADGSLLTISLDKIQNIRTIGTFGNGWQDQEGVISDFKKKRIMLPKKSPELSAQPIPHYLAYGNSGLLSNESSIFFNFDEALTILTGDTSTSMDVPGLQYIAAVDDNYIYGVTKGGLVIIDINTLKTESIKVKIQSRIVINPGSSIAVMHQQYGSIIQKLSLMRMLWSLKIKNLLQPRQQ